MPERYSNYLKAILFPENFCEMSVGIMRNQCFTVQCFNYESKRRRGEDGRTAYHAEDATMLDFTIRINSPENGKLFLSHMKELEPHDYSFLFNATFKATDRIDNYEDAMVASGYIIDIEEVFNSTRNEGQTEQMLMHVKLLLNNITFVGKQKNLVLSIK